MKLNIGDKLKLLNQRGFSLIELTAAAGAGAILLLIGRQLLAEQTKQEANIKARADIAQAMSVLEHAMRDKSTCKSVFQGVGVDTHPASLSYLHPRTGDSINLIRDNTDYGSFRLNAGDIYIADYPALQNQDLINLNITFRLKPGAGGGTVQKRIPLTVSVDGSGNIQECGSVLANANVVSEEKFCETLGATLATWNGTDCVLNAVNCPAGQVVASMNKLGELTCVDALTKVDPNNLFDTIPKDCTGMTNFKLKSVNGKITVECTAGACTPVPACPASWGSNLVLNGEIRSAADTWTAMGFDPAQVEARRAVSGNCKVAVRSNTSCDGSGEFRDCLYNNSSGTGCTADTGASCTPTPVCPATYLGLAFATQSNPAPSWTSLGLNPANIEEERSASDCYLMLRKSTSCNGLDQVKQCYYSNPTGLGCTASCTPPPACPPNGWSPDMTLLSDTIESAAGWNIRCDSGWTNCLKGGTGSSGMTCRLWLRSNTTCYGADQLRNCQYVDWTNTECTAGSTYNIMAPECTPPPGCPTTYAGLSVSGVALATGWTSEGLNPANIDEEVDQGFRLLLMRRLSVQCDGQQGGDRRYCEYKRY